MKSNMPENDDIDFPKMFKEFHVKSEEELESKILEDWSSAKCYRCLKKYDLLTCKSKGSNTICPHCGYNQ